MNAHVGLGWQHVTPERDSRGWQRVVSRGCGLVHYEMEGDYDCRHKYTWGCEGCPIGILSMDAAEAEWRASMENLEGPPRPMRDAWGGNGWLWANPTVATEMALQD